MEKSYKFRIYPNNDSKQGFLNSNLRNQVSIVIGVQIQIVLLKF